MTSKQMHGEAGKKTQRSVTEGEEGRRVNFKSASLLRQMGKVTFRQKLRGNTKVSRNLCIVY